MHIKNCWKNLIAINIYNEHINTTYNYNNSYSHLTEIWTIIVSVESVFLWNINMKSEHIKNIDLVLYVRTCSVCDTNRYIKEEIGIENI